MPPVYVTSPSPHATRAAGHNCDEPCVGSASAPAACTCRCGGRNHGAERATHGPDTPARAATRAYRVAQAFAQAPSDEDAF